MLAFRLFTWLPIYQKRKDHYQHFMWKNCKLVKDLEGSSLSASVTCIHTSQHLVYWFFAIMIVGLVWFAHHFVVNRNTRSSFRPFYFCCSAFVSHNGYFSSFCSVLPMKFKTQPIQIRLILTQRRKTPIQTLKKVRLSVRVLCAAFFVTLQTFELLFLPWKISLG